MTKGRSRKTFVICDFRAKRGKGASVAAGVLSKVGIAIGELGHVVRARVRPPATEKEDVWPRELTAALTRRGVGDVSPAARAKLSELADELDLLGSLNGWMGGVIRG